MGVAFFVPGRKRITPYSIQTLNRFKPEWFREDLGTLLKLLRQGKIEPVIAERIPLAEAARAYQLLGEGSVMDKIILLCGARYGQ